MIVAIVLIGLVFAFANPTFASVTNLSNVASQVSFIGVIAVSSTFVLITGEIDLSVGSIVAVCSVLLGELLQAHLEIWVALIVTLLAGAAMGAFNGLLSLSIQVPTIIITLGMLTAYQGLADQISNGYPLQNFSTSTPFFTVLQSKLWGVVPYDTLVFVAFAILSAIVLRRTTVGLRVYAMGSNRWSAELAGIRLSRIQVGVLTFNGVAAGLSAILGVGFTGTGDPRQWHQLCPLRHRCGHHWGGQDNRRSRDGAGLRARHPPAPTNTRWSSNSRRAHIRPTHRKWLRCCHCGGHKFSSN